MAWPEDVEKILKSGMSLSSLGIDNWALNKDTALLAIEEFRRHRIPILGGDVYEVIGGYPEANYDNWYCDRNTNESLEDFVVRSVNYTRDYLDHYTSSSGREAFFSLVARCFYVN